MLRGGRDTMDGLSQGWGDQDLSWEIWMFKSGLIRMNKPSVSLRN